MYQFLLSIPVLIKILISLIAIIVINRLLSRQIPAVLAGTVILAILCGHSLFTALRISAERFTDINNLFLLFVVIIILVLSSQMKESGAMADLSSGISARFSREASMAILPAVIGLLPMPGGAVFSAPLVDSCDTNSDYKGFQKTRINYWFRHVWEYWWPLYPGVLLAIDISGLEVWQFMLIMFPITLFSVSGAWFFLMRRRPSQADKTNSVIHTKKESIIMLLMPIIIIVIFYAGLSIIFPGMTDISRYLPISLGILAAIVYLQIKKPIAPVVWKKILLSKSVITMVVLVALIRIYGAFIEGNLPDGRLLMSVMSDELSHAGISSFILIMLIPFLCGVSTGIAIGTVGAAFPIVMSLIGTNPDFALVASTTVLAYTFGHAGQLMSPVHVCLIVSNEYFKTGLAKSLSGLIKPVLVVLAAALILSRLFLML